MIILARFFHLRFTFVLLLLFSLIVSLTAIAESTTADTERNDFPLTYKAILISEQGDSKLAVKKLLEAANAGEAKAQFMMYNIYTQGFFGVERNIKTAKGWLEKSAAQNYHHSQYELGRILYTRDTKRSLNLLILSAAQGNENAQTFYTMYSTVNGRTPTQYEFDRASIWAEKGNVYVMDWLATAYYVGKLTKKNYPLAAKWFKRAAKKGNVHSQSSLGIMFDMGFAMERDTQQAKYWLNKAIDTKYQPAINYMAAITAREKRQTNWAGSDEIEPFITLSTGANKSVVFMVISLRCKSCIQMLVDYSKLLRQSIDQRKIAVRIIDASYTHGVSEATAVTQCLITKDNHRDYFIGLTKYAELVLAQSVANNDVRLGELSIKQALVEFKKIYAKQLNGCDQQKIKASEEKAKEARKFIRDLDWIKGFPTFYFRKKSYGHNDLKAFEKTLKSL